MAPSQSPTEVPQQQQQQQQFSIKQTSTGNSFTAAATMPSDPEQEEVFVSALESSLSEAITDTYKEDLGEDVEATVEIVSVDSNRRRHLDGSSTSSSSSVSSATASSSRSSRLLAGANIVFSLSVKMLCNEGCSSSEGDILFSDTANVIKAVIAKPTSLQAMFTKKIKEGGLDEVTYAMTIDTASAVVATTKTDETIISTRADEDPCRAQCSGADGEYSDVCVLCRNQNIEGRATSIKAISAPATLFIVALLSSFVAMMM
jgi:hypothetical protein